MLKKFLASSPLALFLVFLILTFPFLWALPTWSKEVLLSESDRLFGFAMHLYREGDWYRSITEFKKFLFLHAKDPRTKEACYLIGIAFKKGGKWDRAIVQLRRCSLRYPNDPTVRKAIFQIGETYYESGRYDLAISAYQELIQGHSDSKEAQIARYKMGWAYLQLERYREAIETFEAIDLLSSYHDRSSKLVEKLQKTAHSIPYKSPLLAGILSGIIPGAGHLYSEKPKDGIVSFLLNALFITGAVAAFRNDYNITGGIILFLELGWYFGGIYSAKEAAEKSNEATRREYLKSLEQTSFDLIQQDSGGGLLLRIPF